MKSINDGLMLVVKQIKKYEKLFELFKSQYELSGAFENFEDPIESININNWLVSLDSLEERIKESINNINKIIEGLLNDKIKYNSSYKYLFNEIYEEKEYLKPFDFEIINFNLSEISKYEHYAYLLINYIYRNNFKSNRSIDYFNYKKFSINSTELDENLFSMLLFNKKILLDVDYSKKFFIQKYDIFNKITNNQCFLSNYLFKYPTREELTIEQINSINNSIKKIINNMKIFDNKNKFEKELKNKNEKLQKDIEEKKNLLDENENINKEGENPEKDEIDFVKYEKWLDIKKIEKEIEQNEFIIDILNYKFNEIIFSLKANYLIDICFSLQELLYYIYSLNLSEEIPLLYICSNLQLFKFQKEKLILLLEQNNYLKLSNLFSLYEYFESLILPEFIYHINNGYMTSIPLNLAKKFIYIFEKDEIKSNIIFTKEELIEAIRKCLSRYIVSSKIKKDYITEELNKDLFELLLKEDLWGKNIEIGKLKESFNYINDYIKFPIKVKHIFNLFEILIDIEIENYFTFDNFKEEEKEKEEEEEYILKILEERKKENSKETENKHENKTESPKIENYLDEENDEGESNLSIFDTDFDSGLKTEELNRNLKIMKKRKKYIFDLLQKSKFIKKYMDKMNIKDNNKNKDVSSKELITDVNNYGKILNYEKLIKNFNCYIKNPIININISKLKEKKNIIEFGEDITDVILFNKNKIIVSYESKRIEIYLFDKKTFREETKLIPLEIINLDNIKNLSDVNCMKELINGTLLLGTKNGFIMNLEYNEIKKKSKIECNLKVLNQIKLENSTSINELIEINTNIFISHDDNNNNIIWQDNKNKKELNKGNIYKINNILITLDDVVIFYDIKKNFEEIGKIEITLTNHKIINNYYLVGEDDSKWTVHLINIKEMKEIKERYYKPQKSFIIKNICNKSVFNLEKNGKMKLIKIEIINDDIIADNKESIIVESNSHLTNLFDEFFFVCKKGNVSCYGLF